MRNVPFVTQVAPSTIGRFTAQLSQLHRFYEGVGLMKATSHDVRASQGKLIAFGSSHNDTKIDTSAGSANGSGSRSHHWDVDGCGYVDPRFYISRISTLVPAC